MHSAFLAMLDCTVFLTSDFPAVALVLCSEEEAAHGFDRLSHKVSGRAFPEAVGKVCRRLGLGRRLVKLL